MRQHLFFAVPNGFYPGKESAEKQSFPQSLQQILQLYNFNNGIKKENILHRFTIFLFCVL